MVKLILQAAESGLSVILGLMARSIRLGLKGAPVPRFPAKEIAIQLQIEEKDMKLAEFAAKEMAKYMRGDFSAAVDLNKPKDPEPSDFENEVFD